MSNKFKFVVPALAVAGILATAALPGLAQNIAPATPAPGAAVNSNAKADVQADQHKAGADLKKTAKSKKTQQQAAQGTGATKSAGAVKSQEPISQ
jgi:hypothetical protein